MNDNNSNYIKIPQQQQQQIGQVSEATEEKLVLSLNSTKKMKSHGNKQWITLKHHHIFFATSDTV